MLVLLGSCNGNRALPLQQSTGIDSVYYATGYSVRHFANYTQVDVRDPWDTTRMLQRYLLVDKKLAELPTGMPLGTVIRIPIDKVVVYTSVHASIIEQLGEIERVIGVCEPRYMDSKIIQQRLITGLIADLGEATSPNIEKIMDIGANVIITSPFKDSGYGPAEKLGLPIIEAADYMEQHPLGRVEWIRFYGMLFGKEHIADSIFRETEKEYNALKELVAKVTKRPTVLSEKKYGGQWFVPGGNSYMATIYNDAGANYVFKDVIGGGSIPMSFETVLDKAINADVWLVKYNLPSTLTYKGLRSEYTPYENFDAFKNKHIFGCNTGVIPYYEEIPMHPQWLLKDFVYIFHPSLLPKYEPRYFSKIAE
ncbi:MAG: ABC transporter substrate-binding protein [Bacteroidales bacterium]